MGTLMLAPRRTGDGSQQVSVDPGSPGTTNKSKKASLFYNQTVLPPPPLPPSIPLEP